MKKFTFKKKGDNFNEFIEAWKNATPCTAGETLHAKEIISKIMEAKKSSK